MDINEDQKRALSALLNSYKSTNGGKVWPEEYNRLFSLWGFSIGSMTHYILIPRNGKG